MPRHLFCIGAAKAGTTWLYEQLRREPDLFFTPEKELHYFFSRYGSFDRLPNSGRFNKLKDFVNGASRNFQSPQPDPEFARKFTFFQKNLDWFEAFAQGPVTDGWYRRLFANAGERQYHCDFSPSTSKIDLEGIRELRRLSEDVKLIYIMRDPVERLWSHLKFHAQFTGEFDSLAGYNLTEMEKFIRRYGLEEDGQYGAVLTRFLKYFDKSEILVLDFDEIKGAPEGVLRKVSEFLGISPVQVTPEIRDAVNVSKHLSMPEGLMNSFVPDMRNQVDILVELGYDIALKWRQNLQ